MVRFGYALLAGVALAIPAAGPVSAASSLSLTIYNENLALVRDQRDMTLQAGRNRVEFPDVSAEIIPESVVLKAAGLTLVEQNFDFDLLTPTKLMEKAVGQTVQIVRINPGNGAEQRETAKVLAVNDGVTLQIGNRIEILRQDSIPTRVIFDKLPDNLKAKPTLSMLIDATTAGGRNLELNYLTRGLSWRADYVAAFDEKQGSLSLQGWITLTNNSGIAYRDVKTQLVAGSVNRVGGRPMAGRNFETAMVKSASREAFGDYHLYTLPEATTIANNQTKQVSFLDAPTVKATKRYSYEAGDFLTQREAAHVDVDITIANSKADGLGEPLPAGVIRIYGKDQFGQSHFLGEDTIDHTPEGLDIRPRVGKAFDVTVQSTITARREYKKDRYENAMAYRFRNARAEAVTVVFRQAGFGTNWDITAESASHSAPDALSAEWTVTVPAKGDSLLTFTVRQKE
ncbi:DUF4139 domain-containing protein [Govanella unica]|uniref:DUF4139 domain-containing protein n=1 Tax=Govanella unica TaxID=2975056 RepID=A0A9X3TVU4_9PROT|nr:DUF4139 domain-containing protein [Govania unica]MDA5192644.1 DUF4139 domain-containing protein [Govania unica]